MLACLTISLSEMAWQTQTIMTELGLTNENESHDRCE